MKRLLLSILVSMASLQVLSQVVAIQNNAENDIYIGVPNRITVAVEGYKSKNISVTTSNGQIKPDSASGAGHYFVIPSKPGYAELNVYLKKSKGYVKIGGSTFIVKRFSVEAMLRGYHNGPIPHKVVYSSISPEAILVGFCGHKLIKNMTVHVARHHREIFTRNIHDTTGVRFDDTTTAFFRKLKNKDRLTIDSIVYRDFDGSDRQVDPLKFTIIDAHKIHILKVPDTVMVTDPITGQEFRKIIYER